MTVDGTQELVVGLIAPADVAEVTEFLTRSWHATPDERLRLLQPDRHVTEGWCARHRGAIVGAIVQGAADSADVALGHWATAPGVAALLYREAAAAWVLSGRLTHRVTVPAASPVAAELLDLGFGHQQAHGVAATASVPRAQAPGVLRRLSRADASALAEIVPLVSRHQTESPVFAPRVGAFYEQLPASIAEFLEQPNTVAWGHSAGIGDALEGFMLAETRADAVEIVLMGTRAGNRNRGVGSSLLAAAAALAEERGARWLVTDWRTTNPESAQFWVSRGFAPVAYRWCRVIDPTPA